VSTFEIVRGVEGDCLVLDNTRICGPKPWGGGRIIKTFCTDGIYEVIYKDEYRALLADNAKLREELADAPKCETCEAMLDCDECLRADGSHKERRRLSAENAKLRELVRDMFDRVNYECRCCSIFCSDWDEDNECCVFATSMRELGIEV